MTTTTAETCTGAYVPRLHTLEATIIGPVGADDYGVYLRIRYVGGPNSYQLGQAGGAWRDMRNPTLQVGRQSATPTPSWDAQSGTVSVDADGKGGALDAVLVSSDAHHATTTVRGRWHCSAAAPLKQAPAVQGLAVTGAVTGLFASPLVPQAAFFASAQCRTAPGGFNFLLIGSPDGLAKIFQVNVMHYHGPGQYQEGGGGVTISVELIPGYGDPDSRAWALPEPANVALVIDPGEQSGTVDAGLVSTTAGAQDVRVSGRWACVRASR